MCVQALTWLDAVSKLPAASIWVFSMQRIPVCERQVVVRGIANNDLIRSVADQHEVRERAADINPKCKIGQPGYLTSAAVGTAGFRADYSSL